MMAAVIHEWAGRHAQDLRPVEGNGGGDGGIQDVDAGQASPQVSAARRDSPGAVQPSQD